MILSGKEISKRVEDGTLHIKPFLPQNVNPNSYDYRLDNKLIELSPELIDPKKPLAKKTVIIGDDGYVLSPGRLYLASTIEEIGSDYYVTSLIGRSSMGRLGLFVQVTADLGHLGATHKWTLELKTVQPLIIYPGMTLGQVVFWQTEGSKDIKYNGKYAKYSIPKCSEIHTEL